MAISLLLVPWLAVAAGATPAVVTTGTYRQVEAALDEGVRSRIDAGWAVVDMRTENDEFVVTLTRDDAIERHVMHFDSSNSYRVERDVTALPTELMEPDDFTLRALSSARGGFEVAATCGDYYQRPYFVDDAATGELARSMVARVLATADDVHGASQHDGRATFTLGKRGTTVDLVVWLDPMGKVIEAQVRRFESGASSESPSYKRAGAMKRALRGVKVVGISERGASLTLETSRGRFVLDPDGTAFDSGNNGEYEGCGC